MRKFQLSWWLLASILAAIIFTFFAIIPVPMFDGVLYYDKELVHFHHESKIALAYFFDRGLDNVLQNGMLPSKIELKPIGIAVLVVVHFGFPLLVGLRVKFGRERKDLNEPKP